MQLADQIRQGHLSEVRATSCSWDGHVRRALAMPACAVQGPSCLAAACALFCALQVRAHRVLTYTDISKVRTSTSKKDGEKDLMIKELSQVRVAALDNGAHRMCSWQVCPACALCRRMPLLDAGHVWRPNVALPLSSLGITPLDTAAVCVMCCPCSQIVNTPERNKLIVESFKELARLPSANSSSSSSVASGDSEDTGSAAPASGVDVDSEQLVSSSDQVLSSEAEENVQYRLALAFCCDIQHGEDLAAMFRCVAGFLLATALCTVRSIITDAS